MYIENFMFYSMRFILCVNVDNVSCTVLIPSNACSNIYSSHRLPPLGVYQLHVYSLEGNKSLSH